MWPAPGSSPDLSRPALQNRSDRMLAAAQVHATLAVEAAVRELIEKIGNREDPGRL